MIIMFLCNEMPLEQSMWTCFWFLKNAMHQSQCSDLPDGNNSSWLDLSWYLHEFSQHKEDHNMRLPRTPYIAEELLATNMLCFFFQKLQVAFLWQKLGSWWFLSLINCDISCICLHSDPWLTTVPSPAVSTETAVPKGGTYPHLHHLLLVKREQWIWWYPMDSPKNPRHMGSYTQYVPCHCWLHTIYVFSFNTHWEKLKILSFTSLPRYTGNSLHFVVV